ncbi:nucleolar and coiled-body phosphoprotein 1 [Biomphalaria glabrata]|nr:nucleolar and coiled-body phosphoprotein 1 [Biomphalaria glabrata]
MLELEALPQTIVYTIIVVTMATLFLCCWRKKSRSGGVTDGKTSKVKPDSVKGPDKSKESSPSPVVEKSGNGSAIPSPSPASQATPELGDFSVVQRETEILRSYRKPAPPKNRARQSRAPRALNRSTENLDIFTELSEDELKSSDENDENTTDHLDSSKTDDNRKQDEEAIQLRPHSENDNSKRETRSSMLADIENTLARLHSTEESNAVEEATASDLSGKEAVTSLETGRSSPHADQHEGHSSQSNSAHSSPSNKPKVAPKVSPKPIPRKRNAPSQTHASQDDKTPTESSSDTKTNEAVSADHVTSSQAQVTSAPQHVNSLLTLVETEESLAAKVTSPQEDTVPINTATESEQSQIDSDSTSEQECSQPAPETECQTTKETNIKVSVEDLSKPTEANISVQDTQQTVDQASASCDTKPEEDETLTNDKTTKQTITETEADSPLNQDSDEQKHLQTERKSPEQYPAADAESRASLKEDGRTETGQETQSSETEEQTDKEQDKTELTDDQIAKGKQSKIPVRAGIKSGSSSHQDKTSATK